MMAIRGLDIAMIEHKERSKALQSDGGGENEQLLLLFLACVFYYLFCLPPVTYIHAKSYSFSIIIFYTFLSFLFVTHTHTHTPMHFIQGKPLVRQMPMATSTSSTVHLFFLQQSSPPPPIFQTQTSALLQVPAASCICSYFPPVSFFTTSVKYLPCF